MSNSKSDYWSTHASEFIIKIGLDKYHDSFVGKTMLDIHDLPPWIIGRFLEDDSNAIEYFYYKINMAKQQHPYNFKPYQLINYSIEPISSSSLSAPKNMCIKLNKEKLTILNALDQIKLLYGSGLDDLCNKKIFTDLYKSVKTDNHKQTKFWIQRWNYEICKYRLTDEAYEDIPTFGAKRKKVKKTHTNIICKCIPKEDTISYLDNNINNFQIKHTSKSKHIISELLPKQQQFMFLNELISVYANSRFTKQFIGFCKHVINVECITCKKTMKLFDIIVKLNINSKEKWSMKYLNKTIGNIFVDICERISKDLVMTCKSPTCNFKYLKTLQSPQQKGESNHKLCVSCVWCDYHHATHNEHCTTCPKCKKTECIICNIVPFHFDKRCNGPSAKTYKNTNLSPCPSCKQWSSHVIQSGLSTKCMLCDACFCQNCFKLCVKNHIHNCKLK